MWRQCGGAVARAGGDNFPALVKLSFHTNMGVSVVARKGALIALQVVYALLVLLEIPIAFDVCEDCGIALAFLLISYYASMVTIRTLLGRTKLKFLKYLGFVLYSGQILILPGLLIVQLHVCDNMADMAWLHPLKIMLHNATGVFFLLEGFCVLITIQAWGKLWKYLGRRSESFMLVQITFSAINIAVVMFFLLRIYTIPTALDSVSATLIGSALTLTAFLGVGGIVSKKGSAMESSLLFAYVVYVMYVTFTDFQSSEASSSLFPFYDGVDRTTENSTKQTITSLVPFMSKFMPQPQEVPTTTLGTFKFDQTMPPLPPVILDGYYSLLSSVAKVTPTGFRAIADFFLVAVSAITPSVLLSFVVRVGAFMLAMRIIPSIRHPRHQRISLTQHPLLFLVYSYSPCLIIAVYAHLLMQHFGGIVHLAKNAQDQPFWGLLTLQNVWMNSRQSWQFWGWANIFLTLFIYGLELVLGDDVY